MNEFANKVAIVTGGGSGIGKTTAIELAKLGTTVVIACRTEESGLQTVKEITDNGGIAIFVKTDVTKESEIINLVAQTISGFGRLDYAFNNAGVEQTPMPLSEQTEEMYYKIMDTNVKSIWLSMKHQIPEMLKAGGGAIVNTSSFSGAIAFATIPLYVAAKHAVVGLTKSVALEFAQLNIRINSILPGSVENTGTLKRSFGTDDTAMEWVKSIHPMGRLATTKEIADSVIFLLSEKSGFITGHSMMIDGGYSAG